MTDQPTPGGDLLAWLETAITTREQALKAVPEGRRWYVDPSDGRVAEPDGVWADGHDRLPNRHGTWTPLFDPADALRRCAADRKLLELHEATVAIHGSGSKELAVMNWVIRNLAEGYGWTEGEPSATEG